MVLPTGTPLVPGAKPGLKEGPFSPGFVLPVLKPGLKGLRTGSTASFCTSVGYTKNAPSFKQTKRNKHELAPMYFTYGIALVDNRLEFLSMDREKAMATADNIAFRTISCLVDGYAYIAANLAFGSPYWRWLCLYCF